MHIFFLSITLSSITSEEIQPIGIPTSELHKRIDFFLKKLCNAMFYSERYIYMYVCINIIHIIYMAIMRLFNTVFLIQRKKLENINYFLLRWVQIS